LEIAGCVGIVPALFGVGLVANSHATAVVRSPSDRARREPDAERTAALFATPAAVPGGAGLGLGWRF
jgi:hypothetical protein